MGRSHRLIKTKLNKVAELLICLLTLLTLNGLRQPASAQITSPSESQPLAPEPTAPTTPSLVIPSQLAPAETIDKNPATTHQMPKVTPFKKPKQKKSASLNPEEFPPNPLESKEPDPLLPKPEQPLSPQERTKLIAALDLLNAQATALHQSDKKDEAYEIWFRELRLRRALGLVPEIEALGRVGNIVWSDTRIDELRWITERLDTILKQAQPPNLTTKGAAEVKPTEAKPASGDTTLKPTDSTKQPADATILQPTVTKPAETKPASEDAPLKPIDSTKQPATPTTPQPTAPKPVEVTPVAPETEPILDTTDSTAIDSTKPTISAANRIPVLEALGAAYQKVRYPQRAATAYEAVLIDARQRNDVQKVEQTSITLGQLYLSWFNYLKATEIYRELLTTAQTRGNVPNEMSHLATLTYIHEQAKQPDQAIPYQLQLLALYQKLQQTEPLPRLRIQLGDNYLQADRPDLAEQNYQLAYKLAQPLLQFGNASEALQKLGALYRTNERLDAALRVYTFLVALEQQAYNAYGTMDAYDQLGQIHRLRKENAQALAAFQRGLQIAQQLKYREDYFLGQLQQIGQSSGQ